MLKLAVPMQERFCANKQVMNSKTEWLQYNLQYCKHLNNTPSKQIDPENEESTSLHWLNS